MAMSFRLKVLLAAWWDSAAHWGRKKKSSTVMRWRRGQSCERRDSGDRREDGWMRVGGKEGRYGINRKRARQIAKRWWDGVHRMIMGKRQKYCTWERETERQKRNINRRARSKGSSWKELKIDSMKQSSQAWIKKIFRPLPVSLGTMCSGSPLLLLRNPQSINNETCQAQNKGIRAHTVRGNNTFKEHGSQVERWLTDRLLWWWALKRGASYLRCHICQVNFTQPQIANVSQIWRTFYILYRLILHSNEWVSQKERTIRKSNTRQAPTKDRRGRVVRIRMVTLIIKSL